LAELDATVDMGRLETALMEEGVEKFVAPQKALLALIATHR
ncbi:MAG: transaldolase, partial [Planctomycetia bacterium]|nr:transaldolase [Planctomycetia bacterium]